MTFHTEPDARRAAGDRTRARLLAVTSALIAERGEVAVSLRDIAEAAQVNVAAVSYHFGSKDNLCRAAIEAAIDQVVGDHLQAIRALPRNAGIKELSEALVTTILARKASLRKEDRAMLAITARSILGNSSTQAASTAAAREVTDEIFARLRVALPSVKADELRFRIDCVACVLHLLAAGALDDVAAGVSRARLARWLVSTISGSLTGADRIKDAGRDSKRTTSSVQNAPRSG